jgi:DNA-binding transcriptional ArsR family regulator
MATIAAATPPTGSEALPLVLARAPGDPLRLRIVELLASEQLCVAHLADELATAQPLVSHHLKVLREARLVETDRYLYLLPAAARRPGPPGRHPGVNAQSVTAVT